MSDTAAQRLIFAICMQACHDYAKFKRKLEIYPRDTEYQREYNDTIIFFKSAWYESLMPNIDGRSLMRQIDKIIGTGKDIDDVCEQQLRKGVEDLPTRQERAEIYAGSNVYQP